MSEFLVITGLSGAGGSTAATIFEDLGWFVIDNLPAALIGKVAELAIQPGSETERVALVVWSSARTDDLLPALDALRSSGARVRQLFLEAADEAIIRRYEDHRRPHPVGAGGVPESIALERERLAAIKDVADLVIDTTDLNVHELRQRLTELFAATSSARLQVRVVSFGYKHGLPPDVDLVLDCRLLPNPHWVDELRPLRGTDPPVRDYVLSQPATAAFLDAVSGFLDATLPGYVAEGKSYLTIAMGCTGGHHRSVVLAEEVARLLKAKGYPPTVSHRDVAR